jgi:hypothetical protein
VEDDEVPAGAVPAGVFAAAALSDPDLVDDGLAAAEFPDMPLPAPEFVAPAVPAPVLMDEELVDAELPGAGFAVAGLFAPIAAGWLVVALVDGVPVAPTSGFWVCAQAGAAASSTTAQEVASQVLFVMIVSVLASPALIASGTALKAGRSPGGCHHKQVRATTS